MEADGSCSIRRTPQIPSDTNRKGMKMTVPLKSCGAATPCPTGTVTWAPGCPWTTRNSKSSWPARFRTWVVAPLPAR